MERRGTEFSASDPEDILVVSEAADPRFDVGFLKEDGVGVFFVTADL